MQQLRTSPIDIAGQEANQMIEQGQPTHKILTHLVNSAEEMMGEMAISSILVLDKQGLLRNGASPRLPYDYLTAIDGLKPNPRVGTCAAVAATGEMVITASFLEDEKWAELKHLPVALGFISAWSVPIKNARGKILGTFGTYFREKRKPSQPEIDSVISLAAIAARAIEPESKVIAE